MPQFKTPKSLAINPSKTTFAKSFCKLGCVQLNKRELRSGKWGFCSFEALRVWRKKTHLGVCAICFFDDESLKLTFMRGPLL